MAVDAITSVASNSVAGAIRKAAQATGTSFEYLLATAKVESDLNPDLTAPTSTATGLFQFIDQTWLATLKQAGPAFGYGNYADAISRTASGQYVVENASLRNDIMRLRKDPTANALMGGVFTQQNAAVLATALGRAPSEGELYIGHFLGPSAAAKAITLSASNPAVRGADVFPAAAQANRSIFYDKQGNARSIGGVCAELIRRYQAARTQSSPVVGGEAPRPPAATPSAPTRAAGEVAPAVAPAAAFNGFLFTDPAPASALGFAAEPRGAAASPAVRAPADAAGGMFHSLFVTGDRREAISPAITELWSAQHGAPPTSAPDTGATLNRIGTGAK